MLKYLIRKFDSWWLGQIDIGLLQMTHAEYLTYKFEKMTRRIWSKAMLTADPATGEKCFTGIDVYITTGMKIKTPKLAEKVEEITPE